VSHGTREWRLTALTDLWTGSVILKDAKERIVPDRLLPTGLLGSLRWWFEVATRGLGGAACDPSDGGRCPDQHGKRCVVCELFGCTGWGRRFRFEVRDNSGAVMKKQIGENTVFNLSFTPVRPIAAEEWALIDLTIGVITDYAAIGGKTVLKPSDEQARAAAAHHRDYGIVKLGRRPGVEPVSRASLERYVRDGRWRKPPQHDFAWASLVNFWCVSGRYLARQDASRSTFNWVVGRDERKACRDCGGVHDPGERCPKTKEQPRRNSERLVNNDPLEQWLAGRQQESKKVFSFKEPARTFGFVDPGRVSFEQMKQRLKQAWGSLSSDEFVTGDTILERLTTAGMGAS
jgi:CRISPR-associated protein Cmr1